MTTSRQSESPFEADRGIEERYALQLRKLAVKIGSIISRFPDLLTDAGQRAILDGLLNSYSEQITPWAKAASSRVLRAVDVKNRHGWNEHARRMSNALRREILHAPTGATLRTLQDEQVTLIKSIPADAAARVHKIAVRNLIEGGQRAEAFAREIMRSTEVSKSKATLIARTETSRAASNLTQARATYVGSLEYEWATSRDADVRPSHRAMEGKTVFWSNPPTLDGLTGHAGCLPNCRCSPIPRLPDY